MQTISKVLAMVLGFRMTNRWKVVDKQSAHKNQHQ